MLDIELVYMYNVKMIYCQEPMSDVDLHDWCSSISLGAKAIDLLGKIIRYGGGFFVGYRKKH